MERLAERVLFLEGEVEMMVGGQVAKTHNVREMLAKAKSMEEESAQSYNLWANECAAKADAASKKLFEALVDDEEKHFDNFEIQEEHIQQFGEQFLALQSVRTEQEIVRRPRERNRFKGLLAFLTRGE